MYRILSKVYRLSTGDCIDTKSEEFADNEPWMDKINYYASNLRTNGFIVCVNPVTIFAVSADSNKQYHVQVLFEDDDE